MKNVKEFFDEATSTLSYVVWDQETRDALVIDPVLGYDPASSKINEQGAHQIIDFIGSQNLNMHFSLETHAHADHLSGAQIIKREFPDVKIAIGKGIKKVQEVFKELYNLSPEFKTDGSQFDRLLDEGDLLNAGSIKVKIIATPGHTPACLSYLIDDFLFSGDAIFMPDSGTGRCDFPAASAEDLYKSIHDKIYNLPDQIKIFVGHDYQPQKRPLRFISSVAEEKTGNIQLTAKTTRQEFVHFRNERDRTLSAPRLLWPAIQININAGHVPSSEGNGRSYLKIPIHV